MSASRLSRGQSHDFLVQLENTGFNPEMASDIMSRSNGRGGSVRGDYSCWQLAMMVAGWPKGYWSRIVSEFYSHHNLFPLAEDLMEVPSNNNVASVGEMVDRVLDGWMLYYMPSGADVLTDSLGDLGYQEVFPPPFFVQTRTEGYWYWLKLAARVKDLSMTEVQPHCASIEEFVVAIATCNSVGFGKLYDHTVPGEDLLLRSLRFEEDEHLITVRYAVEEGRIKVLEYSATGETMDQQNNRRLCRVERAVVRTV